MRRERARAALRAAAAGAGLLAWRILAFDPGAARAAATRAWAVARHRPDAVIGAALLVGVLVMVAHWAGKPNPEPPSRAVPAEHAMAGP